MIRLILCSPMLFMATKDFRCDSSNRTDTPLIVERNRNSFCRVEPYGLGEVGIACQTDNTYNDEYYKGFWQTTLSGHISAIDT